MDPRERFVLLILASLALLVAAAHALVGVASDVLLVVPLFVLLVPLLIGRYPGERAIARLSSRRAVRRRRPSVVVRFPRRPRLAFVRGGLLLATGMAVRPPPVAAQHVS